MNGKNHRANSARRRSKTKSAKRCRLLRFEPLETRQLLSASSPKVWVTPIPYLANDGPQAIDPPAKAIVPLDQTFKLHSNPTATKVIYLDFDGHITENTAWQGGARLVTPAFSRDDDLENFSNAELEIIQNIWARVSEDFAPFNVNVTTEEPLLEDLIRSGGADNRWGQRVAIGGSSNDWYGGGAGGVAFGSFNWDSDTPCFAFTLSVGNSEKNIAEVISHEAGHTLGLGHDGEVPSTDYYGGHGSGATGWAPIMGVGYSQQLTQWSKGEYPTANNKDQDDLTVLTTRNGFGYKNDDHGNLRLTASVLKINGGSVNDAGIIERNTDVDYFSFFHEGGSFTLNVDPFFRGPNLDVLATIYDSLGNVVATSNPVNSLSASFFMNLSGGTYYLAVEGTGKAANGSDYGYSKYASLGQYTISGTIISTNPSAPTIVGFDAPNVTTTGATTYTITITYGDDTGINVATLGNADARVMGPNGFEQAVTFVSVDVNSNGTPRTVTYQITPPGGFWDYTDNGVYAIIVDFGQVADINGNFMSQTTVGTFIVDILPDPADPTNLIAVGASISRIELTWFDNATNEDGYKIERKTGIAGTWSVIATVGADTSSYRDTGLESATTYYYRVQAFNVVAYSSYSNEDDAKTKAAPPPNPKNVAASKGDFNDKVRVTWSTLPEAVSFEVWRNTSNDSSSATRVGVVSGRTYDDLNVTARTRYWYWVKARNGDGARSNFSNVDSGYVSIAARNLGSSPIANFAFDRNYILTRYSQIYGPLSASQRAGLDQLLTYMERDKEITDVRWVAYMLATAQHETKGTWMPIEEEGKGAGKPYGSRDPVTGHVYYGRGYIQLKEKANYQKVGNALGIDLVRNPHLANNPEIAYRIMSYSMRTGILSGYKLSDFISGSSADYQRARWVVNGSDNASRIATFATRWENMLNRSMKS